MSINPRIKIADNYGWRPCIDPLALGRAMDRIYEGRSPTLISKVVKTLDRLRQRINRP